jgi:DnaK suppressor protein
MAKTNKDKPAPKASVKASKPEAKAAADNSSRTAAKVNGANHAAKAAKPGRSNSETQLISTSLLSGGIKREEAANAKLSPFLKKQKEKLLQLRDGMLDSMMGVAKDNLRARAEGSEASAFGMHQADAGSDAYDRDFALSLLSQEQDALYEIEEALKRIQNGTYGICEMSGKPIPHARLEAIPFARFTVECQSQLEKQHKVTRSRQPVTSLFGLTDEEAPETEDEEPVADTKE